MARKEKKYHFIYKTTNTITGRYYYGMHSTDNLDDGYLGSGRRLRYSINKYGRDVHQREIIEFCPDRSSLKETEMRVVTLDEVAKKDCMNLMVGGEGGFISEEQQRHRSVCGGKAYGEKLKRDPEFREKHNRIVGENMRRNHQLGVINYNTFEGKKHKEETKKKMSESMKGKGCGEKNSQFGTCWITRNGVNKKIKKTEKALHFNNGWVLGRK